MLKEMGQLSVQEVEFAGSTYQVEVVDRAAKETYWPFFQVDQEGKIRDGFCSCSSSELICQHLLAAQKSILGPEKTPLHVRFQDSFWNQLFQQFADSGGYETSLLKRSQANTYLYENALFLKIQGKKESGALFLSKIIDGRIKESPENSLKFSNLSQEEVDHWREGRPSPYLRYLLSFWFDLARKIFCTQGDKRVIFTEDELGFPTLLSLDTKELSLSIKLTPELLVELLPSFENLKANLKLFSSSEGHLHSLHFNEDKKRFELEHDHEVAVEKLEGISLGKWRYLSGKGFYSLDGDSLLKHPIIQSSEVARFIREFPDTVASFYPLEMSPRELFYTLWFDQKWNLHLEAFLFQRGDLQQKGASLIEDWAYLPKKGFFSLKSPPFAEVETVVSPAQISHFISHHRIWLNGCPGFQTHLASVESQLTYTVSENGVLCFHPMVQQASKESRDFGEWVFYKGQGFFSKKHFRIGSAVSVGLEIQPESIAKFIRENKSELETIPHFFFSEQLVKKRGLSLKVLDNHTLAIKPVVELDPSIKKIQSHFFGDYLFIEGKGFNELPVEMRLPDRYAYPALVSSSRVPEFLEEEFPQLQRFFIEIDPKLRIPHKLDWQVHYLARKRGGGLRVELYFQSEYGKVAATDLLNEMRAKKRFVFTEAGLLDLRQLSFQWLLGLKQAEESPPPFLELSTLEFMRLDASLQLLNPPETVATSSITRQVLQELRNFTTYETPNLKGLKSELRLYQHTGLMWLWFLYKNGLSGLLCDDMGLGKTHQSMALMAAVLNQKEAESHRFLVVCPTSVIYHWQDKLATFLPGLHVHTFYGLKRSLKGLPKEGVLLTTYGVLRLEQQKLGELSFELAIYDEVQLAKNPRSRLHQALSQIKANMQIGLTGTPIENNLRELKALFDLVLPGYLPSEARFREMFIHPIEREFSEEKKNVLSQLIRPFTLRRRKKEVLQELPEKSEDKSYCELSEEQATLYRETLTQSRDALITGLRDQAAPIDYIHIFSILSRLKQVCNHPALVHKDPKNYKGYSSGKWELFTELLAEARESEQKVVVFSQYLYMLDIIESYLNEQKWGYAQIRGDTIDRREQIKRFQEDPSCLIFIGSLQAAGLGIDLTAASVVILYDRWWNAARENQAIDRVHRIGQKWGVQVYKLITKGTIEEKIDRMITRKGELLEEVIGTDDQAVLKKFTRSELIDLLSF